MKTKSPPGDFRKILERIGASRRGSSTAIRCPMSIGWHGRTSITSRRGFRWHSASRRPKRRSRDSHQNPPKWNASEFRSASRNWPWADSQPLPIFRRGFLFPQPDSPIRLLYYHRPNLHLCGSLARFNGRCSRTHASNSFSQLRWSCSRSCSN
jgi:hypothetical protein